MFQRWPTTRAHQQIVLFGGYSGFDTFERHVDVRRHHVDAAHADENAPPRVCGSMAYDAPTQR